MVYSSNTVYVTPKKPTMVLQPLFRLPRPSRLNNTSFASNGLFNLPVARTPKDSIATVIALYESKHSLRALFHATDNTEGDNEFKSKASITFHHDDGDDNKPPMAFAEDLFHNHIMVPLCQPSLKLPPRLQVVSGGGLSPRSPRIASSPKSPCKVRGFNGGKDFDPFVAAVKKIRKDDASLKPFCWRQLEKSFKESIDRVFEDELGGESKWDLVSGDEGEVNGGKRSNNYYCKLKVTESRCCKNGRQDYWKLLSCFLWKKSPIGKN